MTTLVMEVCKILAYSKRPEGCLLWEFGNFKRCHWKVLENIGSVSCTPGKVLE
jgi:hypothetical protein